MNLNQDSDSKEDLLVICTPPSLALLGSLST